MSRIKATNSQTKGRKYFNNQDTSQIDPGRLQAKKQSPNLEKENNQIQTQRGDTRDKRLIPSGVAKLLER